MTRTRRSQSGCDMLMQAFISQPALMSAATRFIDCFFDVQYDWKCKIVRQSTTSSVDLGIDFPLSYRGKTWFSVKARETSSHLYARREIHSRSSLKHLLWVAWPFSREIQRSIASHFKEKHFRSPVPIRRSTPRAQFPLSAKALHSFIVDFLSWVHRIHEGRDRVY